ncbi:hypothetical protein EC968_009444 [Mortierella alpina]|nr:hypothetical protein EC968_009444 [Mortierella alpina]
MHQDHNIPWKTLASYFAVMEDPRPRHPDLPVDIDFRPLERPDRGKMFTHFSKVLINTIHVFADTERGKYPSKFQVRKSGDVFSNEVIQKCSRYSLALQPMTPCLNDTNQKLEHWISRVRHPDTAPPHNGIKAPSYQGVDRDLGTIIKILIAENEMLPVLELASHPSVPMETLYMPDRPNCGWNQLAKYTLQVYIYINILAEFPEYCQGRHYVKLRSFQGLMDKATHHCEPEELFHYSYLGALDEEGVWRPLEFRSYNYDAIDLFGDMKRLKEYLKACFAVLYRTEMLARECGKVIPWDNLMEIALARFHVTLQWHRESTENGEEWVATYN